MSKTIVIFGAGTGLGISTARRLGPEGYQVALIGRRAPALWTLVDQLRRRASARQHSRPTWLTLRASPS